MGLDLNGLEGDQVTKLIEANMDPRVVRPFVHNGQAYIDSTDRHGKEIVVPVSNANASLTKDAWLHLDEAVMRIAQPELKIFNTIRASSSYNMPGGMAKTVLQTQRMSDIGPATISMDGIREGESDQPEFDLTNFPLPIIHKDFFFTARQIAESKNSGAPLDTSNAELATEKVAQTVEKLGIGILDQYAYGGGYVYGMLNFPQRLTFDVTSPLEGGWTPARFNDDILAMKQLSRNKHHNGPWHLFTAPEWDQYLDDDYSAAKGDNTLRERVGRIEGVGAPITADFLTPDPTNSPTWRVMLVEKKPTVCRSVIGMDIVTVQWDSHGGMRKNFKVMCILLLQMRADMDGNTGIVVGVPA